MRQTLALLLFSILVPKLGLAADCQDPEIFNAAVLSSAATHLVEHYGTEAAQRPVESCEYGPGAVWRLSLAAHQQDEDFVYYPLLRCTPDAKQADAITCHSHLARRIKYANKLIDTDDSGDADELRRSLACFSQAIQAGKVKIQRYNSLLDTTLSIPIKIGSKITSIYGRGEYQSYEVSVLRKPYRFSVTLNKEFGCFIEPLNFGKRLF
jgi:hypothetical protein